ncbi:MAG: hypothetical protein LBT41_01705 [Candidatus Methanoplasma sp.]|jgi:hypothetical protein|nr:hypothetical protein [Candidatus Methanoplasma sp.]
MKGVPDRYVILALSTVAVAVLTLVVAPGDPSSDHEIGKEAVGIVFDIRESANGYTFSFEDADGAKRRCYYSEMPVDDGVYAIVGNTSEDGKMFFVREMRPLA